MKLTIKLENLEPDVIEVLENAVAGFDANITTFGGVTTIQMTGSMQESIHVIRLASCFPHSEISLRQ